MGPDRSGMPPEHSQTLLGHFWKNSFFVKNLEKCSKNHEMSTGRKTDFFWETMKIKKTRIATTRISAVRWPPHLPYGAHSWKNVFWQKHRFYLQLLRTHKILVHAQDSCACTGLLYNASLFYCIIPLWLYMAGVIGWGKMYTVHLSTIMFAYVNILMYISKYVS